jgi:hypothetical protein
MNIENRPYLLVKEGKSCSSIVISEQNIKAEIEAAGELQYYLEKIAKVKIPIISLQSDSGQFLIFVGSVNEKLNLDLPDIEKEGFIIRTGDNSLHIIAADDSGLFFAVSTILEKYFDVRWFWPGELGENVPEYSVLSLPEIDIYETPDFKWRDRGPGGPLWGNSDRISKQKELGVSKNHLDEVKLWERRNKLGGMKIWGGHEQANIVPPQKYGEDHVEYFALIEGRRDRDFEDFDGKHGAQLCTTNPDLIPVFSQYFDDFFEKHPDVDALHVTPNDGGRFCQCEKCQALDTGKRLKKNPEKPVITDRIYTFINTLARELQKKHPGKCLACMAYSWYAEPPERITIDDHVIPQYCLWSCYLHWNDEKKKEHYTIAKGWKEKTKNFAIYEYFINGAWPDLPRIVYPKIAESLRFLHSIGINLYQCQAGDGFAINGLNYYIASKLWWDVHADVDALVKDYYEKAFGKAGKWIESYHNRLQDAWQKMVSKGEHPSCSSFATSIVHELYTQDLLIKCREDLEKAKKDITDPLILKRIEFVEKGLEYTELTIQAVTLTKQLEAKGITISAYSFTDEEEITELSDQEESTLKHNKTIMKLIDESLRAWNKRDNFVETLKHDYVISYFWIKYNDANRVFNPTKRLKELQDRINIEKK